MAYLRNAIFAVITYEASKQIITLARPQQSSYCHSSINSRIVPSLSPHVAHVFDPIMTSPRMQSLETNGISYRLTQLKCVQNLLLILSMQIWSRKGRLHGVFSFVKPACCQGESSCLLMDCCKGTLAYHNGSANTTSSKS